MLGEQEDQLSTRNKLSTFIQWSTNKINLFPFNVRPLGQGVPRGQKNALSASFPRRLFRTRETVGIDASNLSTLAGVATGYVLRLEDSVSTPCLDTLEKVAAAIGVPPGWLAYGYEGNEPFRERYPRPIFEPSDPSPDDSLRSFRALHLGFPARLKQARERSDLSMRTLSTAAGISVQAWSNSEAGKVVPRVDTCERMAVALGVAPSWLAYGEGNAPN